MSKTTEDALIKSLANVMTLTESLTIQLGEIAKAQIEARINAMQEKEKS